MSEYLKGLVFILCMIVMMNALGRSIHKSEKAYENFLYGFVIYTAFQSMGGVIAQFFRLPWIFYQGYMICLWIVMMLIVIVALRNDHAYWTSFTQHMKTYWMVYSIAFILVALSILNIEYQWNCNLIDDGYYLNKVAMAPYVENYVDYNYATGFSYTEGLVRIVNTFEIEAAFYTQLLHMSASVFCKVFLAYFHYLLFLFGLLWLYRTIWKQKEQWPLLRYVLFFVLFFGIYQEILDHYGILYLQDSWQFNTAMWYGSSIVRNLGLILLMVPILEDEKWDYQKILFLLGSVITLVSKASQAFPVVVLVFLSYVIVWCYQNTKKQPRYYVAIVLIFIVLILLPGNELLTQRAMICKELLIKNGRTLVVMASLIVCLLSFFFKEQKIRQWNIWLICIGILMFVPKVNTLFLQSSMYDFVMGRTMTLYIVTVMMSAACYSVLLLHHLLKKDVLIKGICVVSGCMLAMVPVLSKQRNFGLKRSAHILSQNMELLPSSTIALGNTLQELSKTRQTPLYVLSPAWVMMDGNLHSLAAMIRYAATDIISVSALPRYQSVEDPAYATFTQKEQDVFEYYANGSNLDATQLRDLIEAYQINCMVVTNADVAEQAQKDLSFTLTSILPFENKEGSYYILIN